jgi:hypothetical protein
MNRLQENGLPPGLVGSNGPLVEVNVTVPPGTTVDHSQRQDGRKQIHDIIVKEVNQGLQNGEFDRSMGQYGVKRVGIPR